LGVKGWLIGERQEKVGELPSDIVILKVQGWWMPWRCLCNSMGTRLQKRSYACLSPGLGKI